MSIRKVANAAGVVAVCMMLVFIVKIVVVAGANSFLTIRFAVAECDLTNMRIRPVMGVV